MSPFSLFRRHVASFLSMFKLVVIGLIIVGKDPFALFGMQAPGIWEWGQGNKVSQAIIVTNSLILKCLFVLFLFAVMHNKANFGHHSHVA